MPSPSLTGRDDEDRSLRELRVSSHTPGPWGFGKTLSHERIILGNGGTGQYVCHVTIKQALGGPIGSIMDPMREANARLIAAAPDMYEALVKIAAFNDKWASLHLSGTSSYNAFDEPGSVQIAREALAALSQATAKQER